MQERILPFGRGDRVHVVGAAGVGMSAVAQLLLDAGCRVTGSDRFMDQGVRIPVLSRLTAAGVELVPQDGSAVQGETRAVVTSTAIEDDNPDRLAAQRGGVPVLHRAEVLAGLCRGRRVAAVAGTAGKTTVTGLAGWILTCLDRDPTVVNGGAVLNWRAADRVGNVRYGGSDLWVVEVDESDRSLLQFAPHTAAITNISQDHFSLAEVTALFHAFAGQVCGAILAGPGVAEALGLEGVIPVCRPVCRREGAWWFDLEGLPVRVPMPGRHNAENASMAAALCRALDCPVDGIAGAVAAFQGIERRLQVLGHTRGVCVIDDYAHNPVKIAAAWNAAAESSARILAVWRPHGFGPLALMFDELVEAFARVARVADRLYLLPVFFAGGTATGERTAEELAAALQKRGVDAVSVDGYPELDTLVRGEMRAGDTVLAMGARDPALPRWAEELAGSEA